MTGLRALGAGLMAAVMLAGAAFAAEPRSGTWTAPDFHYHTGQVAPLTQHYFTLGSPSNPAVLVLHGTGGTAEGMLGPAFGGQLFGPGQPLDADKYFIIVPDSIGAGQSSKPSDGLHMRFPSYTYADMVQAQHRLLTEHLHVSRLKLVIGNSMGGMMTWQWGEDYPDFMEALVPLASQPIPVSGRNWITRRMVMDVIKADPAWMGGEYKTQPPGLALASTYFGLLTNGGLRNIYAAAPNPAAGNRLIDDGLKSTGGDANDTLYQYNASRDFDPVAALETIKARVLAINSQDDERNPPELGVMEANFKRIRNGRFHIIPTGPETRGHGTTANARLWRDLLPDFLAGR
jgi:homoserine O-acetyltransferase